MRKKTYTVLIPILILMFSACNSSKNIPSGKYLLNKYEIESPDRLPGRSELGKYVKQQPNKKILGSRFNLGLYNLADPNKDNWFNNWLRKIGEEPVIYDPYYTAKTSEQLQKYFRNKGYYYAEVHDSVSYGQKKATVKYFVDLNQPYYIKSIHYEGEGLIKDTALLSLVKNDSVSTLLHVGDILDSDVLLEEIERLTDLFKSKGYYGFIKDYIYFEADTNKLEHQADLYMGIKDPYSTEESSRSHQHPKYKISRIMVYPDFDQRLALRDSAAYYSEFDTILYQDLKILTKGKMNISPKVLKDAIYFTPGNVYNVNEKKNTEKSLSNLKVFKNINILFQKDREFYKDSLPGLICYIQLSQLLRQSYDLTLEGTHSSGNIGVNGNVSYRHKNLMGGAENFDIKFKGALEMLKNNVNEYKNMLEYGIETNLNLPKFLLPIHTENFYKKYKPRTSFSFNYNYQRRPVFTRTISNFSFGYYWNSSKYIWHTVNPIVFNYINVSDMSDDFSETIRNTYIESSFQTHSITVSNYSFLFNNQDLNKNKDVVYLRFNAESAGSLLTGFNRLAGSDMVDEHFELLGTPYAQYFKTDVDFRYYQIVNKYSKFVYRTFLGLGVPYGNASVLPFEKKYFSGGSNGIRAWHVRSLGPGSYEIPENESSFVYPNQIADMKLEFNLEYRFDLFWVVEGALFLDAGNIWSINSEDEREGAVFHFDQFYDQIAIGTGFGTRFDFSFFVFRLDIGMKIRTPYFVNDTKWIIGKRPLNSSDFVFNFGIGYPF